MNYHLFTSLNMEMGALSLGILFYIIDFKFDHHPTNPNHDCLQIYTKNIGYFFIQYL